MEGIYHQLFSTKNSSYKRIFHRIKKVFYLCSVKMNYLLFYKNYNIFLNV
jgi:hypothetical protein